MTIGVECPHCESQFFFERSMIGKSVRCPNPACGEPFIAQQLGANSATPGIEPEVYDAEVIEPRVAQAKPMPVAKAAALPTAAALPKAIALGAPREVKWSEDGPPVAPPGITAKSPAKPKPRKPLRDDDTEIPIRTRTAKSSLPKFIFIGLALLLLSVIGGTLYVFFLTGQKNEATQAAEADQLYKDGKYGEARTRFDELEKAFPSSAELGRYTFFKAIAAMQADIGVVTVKENPQPAVDSLTKFLAANGESPLAQPGTGYGPDIIQAGQKLTASLGEHAASHVAKFKTDRTKGDEIKIAQASIATGRDLIPKLEKYRGKSDPGFDDARKKFDSVEESIAQEQARLLALEPWRGLPDDPTDLSIAEFEKAMKQAGLGGDAEALGIAGTAKANLRKLVKFGAEPAPAIASPNDGNMVAAPVSRIRSTPIPRAVADASFEVVTTVARGLLYVMEARTGNRLWSARIATDPSARNSPMPLRVKFSDAANDWLLVPSLLDTQAGLTARRTRTGEAIWYQPLPAPIIGAPVQLGSRVIVALKDAKGTLMQFDAATGNKLDQGEIRQPIGGGIVVMKGTRNGHGFLFVPGEARRLFVFEVGKEDENGRRLPPQPSRVYGTDHPSESLNSEPLLIASENPMAPRRLIFTQRDGPLGLKLRSFAVPTLEELAVPQAAETGDLAPPGASEATVGGWCWFPPVTDGERIAVATDSGLFAVFGLNQPGNSDQPLFEMPGKKTDGNVATVSRGLVVAAEEDGYWIIQHGKLIRMRVAVDAAQGYRLVAQPDPITVGEPMARSTIFRALNLACITVKSPDQTSIQMIAFDLENGDIVWRRQLGAVAVQPPVAIAENQWLYADECGGVHKVTRSSDSDALQLETVAEPLDAISAPAMMAASADSVHLWVTVGVPSKEGNRLLVRRFRDGKKVNEVEAVAPAFLAGWPCTFGEQLLLPLANGFVYRLAADANTLVQGPAWRGPNAKPEQPCFLRDIDANEFLATDGDGTSTRRWKWPATAEKAEKAGDWETTDLLTTAPLWVPVDGKPMLISGDATGVSAFDPARVSGDAIRRWKGAASSTLPPGKATLLTVIGKTVVYRVDGKAVVALDPTKDQPVWVVPAPAVAEVGDVVGIGKGETGVLISYGSGLIREVNLTTGALLNEGNRLPGAPPLAGGAVIAKGNRAILTVSDGSAGLTALGK